MWWRLVLFNVFSFFLFPLGYLRQILVYTNVTDVGVTPATVASLQQSREESVALETHYLTL